VKKGDRDGQLARELEGGFCDIRYHDETGKSGGQERRDGMACWAGIEIRRADNVSLDQVQVGP
jgi:hypothetical protein